MRKRGGLAAMLLAFVVVLLIAAFTIGGCAVSGYNRAIGLEEDVSEKWSQVENVLQRRYDLIPNLVETVKGYAAHEEEVFTQIARSREQYFQANSRDGKIEAAQGLERALSRLLVLQERYPELKAQANFSQLMDALEGTENRISVERRRYNEAVRDLNAYTRKFFGRMFASLAGVEPAEYFEADEAAAEAPQVKFTEAPGGETP